MKPNPFMEARWYILREYLSEGVWKSVSDLKRNYDLRMYTRKQVSHCLGWALSRGLVERQESKHYGYWWWYNYRLPYSEL